MMDIEALIPHRDRMKLLDEVIAVNEDIAVTSARVSERWPLCRGAYVDPIVLIEIVAQTAAVHISWKKGIKTGGRGRGWIVGIKNADFFVDRIPLDTVLIATVKDLYHIDQYSVLDGEVTAEAKPLCRVQIQVFRETDEEKV
jgi:predicted hotdog family 3-hydroxylacyl-ACP dehydratase